MMPEGLGTERVDQVAYWNGAVGERWVAYQEALDAAFADVSSLAIARADPRAGESVLDIGCGTGSTVLDLAGRVGPSGAVLGVDISRPMVEVALRRLRGQAVPQARVTVADAGRPVPGGPFDLAFSRFGVMFFDEPVTAFRAIRGALKPTGRLVFACWQPLAKSTWFRVPTEALLARLPGPPPPPTDPEAPGPFALADTARVRTILHEAGFEAVAVEPGEAPVTLGPVAAATELVSTVGPASRALALAEEAQLPALVEVLRATLAAHAAPDGVVRLSGAVWLVTARASALR